MALTLKTFVSGQLIVAAEMNSNFGLVNTELFSLDNDNIAGGAGIVDTKLAQITTGNKVDGSAIVAASIDAVIGSFGWFLDGTQLVADHQGPTQIVGADVTATDCKMYINTAPTDASVEVDIEKKRGAGDWTTIFTTLPKIISSANTDDDGHVFDATEKVFQADDLLRLNVDIVGSTEEGQNLTVILTCSQKVPQ
jgi:hypothetical protein